MARAVMSSRSLHCHADSRRAAIYSRSHRHGYGRAQFGICVHRLERRPFDGVVFTIDPRDAEWYDKDYWKGQIDWARMTPPEFRYLDENSLKELKIFGVNKKPFEKEYFHKNGTRVPILIAGAMLDKEFFNGVAFVMDKLLRKIGLSGRSCVPMIMGFGCSVPAVMATWPAPDALMSWWR